MVGSEPGVIVMFRALVFFVLSLISLRGSPVSYNRDIRPILSENCFFCHGFDKDNRKGELRLDTFEGATENAAIVPGQPEQSELVSRIFSSEDDEHMPPIDSVYRLTASQKDTLVQWIKEGAQYETHWAYQALTRPALPEDTPHPIDAFVKRVWQANEVMPVKKAKPRTLLRRLSYDLRGLPPTYEEVVAFENDPSQNHYFRFVDQWLTSLEHAEHQALLWLDLVRYADSSGMVSDEPIASGPYRKYVIESYHANMPFDQFTREQLAGDLMPNRNDRMLVASGYNRLVKTNSEAGVIEKEALYALKGEHVRALGTVWLGATTGCAECHDHKYDPITAKDYYSLAAFFDPLIEAGVYEPGDRRVPLHHVYESPESSQREHKLALRIDSVRERLYESPLVEEELLAWSGEILMQEKRAKEATGTVDWTWFPAQLPVAQVSSGVYEQVPAGRRVQAAAGEVVHHLAGETMKAGYQGKSEGFFTHVTFDREKPPAFVALQVIHGAYRRLGWHSDYRITYYWGDKIADLPAYIDPNKLIHMGALPNPGDLARLEVPVKKFGRAPYQPKGMAWIQSGGTAVWGDSGYRTSHHQAFMNEHAGSFYRYFWELPLNRDDRDDAPNLLIKSLNLKPDDRRPIHQQVIEIAFREHQNPALVSKLTELYRQVYQLRQSGVPALVSKVGQVKTTHVLERANFMDESGPIANPAIPEVFGTLLSKNPNRLDLANWLVSKENPLTARVFVNRLWHQFYGRGISETLEDSGNQGDWPSHIELLDWLAVEFQEQGWDRRHLTRLLVTADAYQLSSIPTPELAESDPTNRLHARQGRSRHGAEEIRDSALLAAGLLKLTNEIPVDSFFPYQPSAYWEKSNKIMYGSRYQVWDTDTEDSQYQRSLYTFWKRQNIHPSMLAFDAPTRQECTAKRAVTNTPAQALALLNDPQFVEAARVLASRILTDAQEPDRLVHLFRITLQRSPTSDELAALSRSYKKLVERFREFPEEAKALVAAGQAPSSDHDPIEHAAWTATARIMLNLHEFITRS